MNVRRLFIYTSLVFLAFTSISSLKRDTAQYLGKRELCPYLGELHSWQIPARSILLDKTTGKEKVLVRTGSGKLLHVSDKYLKHARSLSTEAEANYFLKLYSHICGGNPYFQSRIAHFRDTRSQNLESRRRAIRDRKRFSATLEYSWRERNARRRELISQIDSLKSQLGSIETKQFQVMGKVILQKGTDLIVYGSSVPGGASKLQVPGFVYNGLILIQNFQKSDIVSPSGFSTQHVQALDLEYVGSSTAQKWMGEGLPLSVFRHAKPSAESKKLQEIRRQIKEQMAQLSELY